METAYLVSVTETNDLTLYNGTKYQGKFSVFL